MKCFLFMCVFDMDFVFMCFSIDKELFFISDYKIVVVDLREMGCMVEVFLWVDGGCMLKIGYEGLLWV